MFLIAAAFYLLRRFFLPSKAAIFPTKEDVKADFTVLRKRKCPALHLIRTEELFFLKVKKRLFNIAGIILIGKNNSCLTIGHVLIEETKICALIKEVIARIKDERQKFGEKLNVKYKLRFQHWTAAKSLHEPACRVRVYVPEAATGPVQSERPDCIDFDTSWKDKVIKASIAFILFTMKPTYQIDDDCGPDEVHSNVSHTEDELFEKGWIYLCTAAHCLYEERYATKLSIQMPTSRLYPIYRYLVCVGKGVGECPSFQKCTKENPGWICPNATDEDHIVRGSFVPNESLDVLLVPMSEEDDRKITRQRRTANELVEVPVLTVPEDEILGSPVCIYYSVSTTFATGTVEHTIADTEVEEWKDPLSNIHCKMTPSPNAGDSGSAVVISFKDRLHVLGLLSAGNTLTGDCYVVPAEKNLAKIIPPSHNYKTLIPKKLYRSFCSKLNLHEEQN